MDARKLMTMAVALPLALGLAASHASAISAPDYVVTGIALPDFASGDVVVVGDALFVGVGPGFSGAAQSVIRIDAGGTTTVADGFNALSGFAYDAVNDRLLVTDNGLEALGSETGDTVYGIANAQGGFAAPLRAKDIELLPAGSVPGISDIALDPNDPTGNRAFVSDASSSFPPTGRLLSVDLSVPSFSEVQGELDYAAGLAANADTLFFGNVDADTFQGSVASVALPGATGATTPITAGLGGQYDLELEASGTLLATGATELLRIDPSDGATTTLASGFGFATGLFTDASGSIWVLDGGFPGVAAVYRLEVLPEPDAALLAALGFAVLTVLRRPGTAR